MRFPTQIKTIQELEPQALNAVSKIRDSYRNEIKRLWNKTKIAMEAHIHVEYRNDFGSSQTWDVASAMRNGTLQRIDSWTTRALQIFHEESTQLVSKALKEIYRETTLRQAWILDQVTPPSYKIRIPRGTFMTEAETPNAQSAMWDIRWALWIDSYRSALNQNLKLGAINKSDLNQAMDEVTATRAGSPSMDLEDALIRVYDTQTVATYSTALEDLTEMNDDIEMVKIWQTRYNARVCDICSDNAGLQEEEVDDDIPAHPNCECYWRIVPASWAELLQSGDLDERELAKALDAQGVVPGQMAVLNDDGDLVGNVIVTYNKWLQGNSMSVGGGFAHVR